ncbi:unnamed protein product [Prunus armeniaca]
MTSQNRMTKIPQKVMRYLPLKPRLQQLYMSTHTATIMRWHKEKRVDDDVMRHPADGEAWKEFDRTFPEFDVDPRNVRFGLATDGFNPYGVEHKGLYGCPVYKEDVTSGWHAEKVCYLAHRRWLPWDHE